MRKTSLDMVQQLAREDPRVVFVGSDLGPGVLSGFKEEMPDRFFMEGVSEANVVGMAAGLAREGFIPFINTIATFLTRRCFEQIAIDICLHNLPVRLIGNGGGLVYAPLGPTHQAIDDFAILRVLPNMSIVAPADAEEMKQMMVKTLDWPGPLYIRLGKGGDPIITSKQVDFEIGRAISFRTEGNVLIVTTGVMTHRCLSAAERLERAGIFCRLLHMPTVKPLDNNRLFEEAGKVDLIVTVEEHFLTGGFGSAILETLADGFSGPMPTIKRLGLPDSYIHHYGSQDLLLDQHGLQPTGIFNEIKSAFEKFLDSGKTDTSSQGSGQ